MLTYTDGCVLMGGKGIATNPPRPVGVAIGNALLRLNELRRNIRFPYIQHTSLTRTLTSSALTLTLTPAPNS